MRFIRLAVIALAAALAVPPGMAFAQTPPPAADAPPPVVPASPSPLQPGDAFGEETELPERTIVFVKGQTNWDKAFETLLASFKTLSEYVEKQHLKQDGPAIVIYTETDDTGFQFRAALPIAEAPKTPPKGAIAVGKSPSGKALKFIHRGSYDAMDTTYEAITNHLDEKRLEAKDLFVEEYTTDPLKTEPDRLVVIVYVPIK